MSNVSHRLLQTSGARSWRAFAGCSRRSAAALLAASDKASRLRGHAGPCLPGCGAAGPQISFKFQAAVDCIEEACEAIQEMPGPLRTQALKNSS